MHKEKLDKSGKFGFALANLGVFFGKHDIKEDLVNPVVAYKSDYEALTNYEEWRSDGSTIQMIRHILLPRLVKKLLLIRPTIKLLLMENRPINTFHGYRPSLN